MQYNWTKKGLEQGSLTYGPWPTTGTPPTRPSTRGPVCACTQAQMGPLAPGGYAQPICTCANGAASTGWVWVASLCMHELCMHGTTSAGWVVQSISACTNGAASAMPARPLLFVYTHSCAPIWKLLSFSLGREAGKVGDLWFRGHPFELLCTIFSVSSGGIFSIVV